MLLQVVFVRGHGVFLREASIVFVCSVGVFLRVAAVGGSAAKVVVCDFERVVGKHGHARRCCVAARALACRAPALCSSSSSVRWVVHTRGSAQLELALQRGRLARVLGGEAVRVGGVYMLERCDGAGIPRQGITCLVLAVGAALDKRRRAAERARVPHAQLLELQHHQCMPAVRVAVRHEERGDAEQRCCRDARHSPLGHG
mmetsp:Transcript_15011/g.21882  ORF Transcript_15011/g.21882 Transcript_15011/m.21882 type:complete len:201 (+) Transcript_15011:588-1190(+)